MSNEEFLRKIVTRRKFVLTIRKRGLTFLGRIMEKEFVVKLTVTCHNENKRSHQRQRIDQRWSMMVKGNILLKAKKDKEIVI